MNALLLLRLINIILISIAGTLWVIFYKKYKMIFVIAPLSWLVHTLLYGIYRFITPETIFNIQFMQTWTAIIITHALILLLLYPCLHDPKISHQKKE